MNHKYGFDVLLGASLQIEAANEDEARAHLKAHFDCVEANLGELNGKTLVAEVSLEEGWKPVCYEINNITTGNAMPDLNETLGSISDFLCELHDCFSADGEFNSFTASMGLADIRRMARVLAEKLGAQFPDDEDEDDDSQP